MHCKLKSFNISLFCLCVCPALLLCQCCTGMTAKWSRTLCSYQAAPLTAPWRSLWESQSSLFQKTGTRSVKCLQKGEIQVNIFEDKHKSEWLCDHWCLFSFFFLRSDLESGGVRLSALPPRRHPPWHHLLAEGANEQPGIPPRDQPGSGRRILTEAQTAPPEI